MGPALAAGRGAALPDDHPNAGHAADGRSASIARAIPLFPLAGAVIGALLVGLGLACGALWDAWVRSVVIVVGWGVITAGLHLDGLSDTFDAVMSWRPRERKLEIMKDSRIGAMGALALIAVLALKVTWLHAAGDGWLRAVWLAPVLGRWADTYGIFWFPPARAGGLGREFQAQVRRGRFRRSPRRRQPGWRCILAGPRGLLALALVWGVSQLAGPLVDARPGRADRRHLWRAVRDRRGGDAGIPSGNGMRRS